MSAEENEVIGRRWMEAWNSGDLAALDDLYTTDFIYHMRFPGQSPGLAGEKQVLSMLHAAFPDLRMTIDEVIANENSVMIRWTMPGTHAGVFMSVQPTGKRVTQTGIDILRIVGGKVAARWDEVNRLETLQQIGALPAPKNRLAPTATREPQSHKST